MTAPRRCPACGVTYRNFRCGFAFGRAAKGSVAAPNGAKAEAWAVHVDTCDAWDMEAVSFEPAAFDASRTSYTPVPSAADPFGADDLDPVEVCLTVAWEAREALARRILGADYERVTEAA